MTALGDALGAIKSIILIDERVKSHGVKLEKVAELLVEMDRRLVRVETTLELALRSAAGPAIAPPIAPSG